MNALLSESLIEQFDSQLQPHINILLFYQDPVSGQRALGLYNRLLQQLLPDYRFHLSAFGFDQLDGPEMQHTAAQKAADADLIMVSVHNDHDLPKQLVNCFDVWLDQRTEMSQALVALLCGPSSESVTGSSVCDYLRQVSEDAGISFFSDVSPYARSKANLAPDYLTIMEQPIATSRWLDQMLRRSDPVQHWGLNE